MANFFPNQLNSKTLSPFPPTTVNSKQKKGYRTPHPPRTPKKKLHWHGGEGGDFHDSDKRPIHVEMVRTKCQPNNWHGQNANHSVRLAFCPTTINMVWLVFIFVFYILILDHESVSGARTLMASRRQNIWDGPRQAPQPIQQLSANHLGAQPSHRLKIQD